MKGIEILNRRSFLVSSAAMIGALLLPEPSYGASVGLSYDDEMVNSIVESLRGVGIHKYGTELEDVDFSSLLICRPIHCYEAIGGELRETEPHYPILDQLSNLRMFGFDIGAESPIISTALAEQLDDIAKSNKEIALVYDVNGCYVVYSDGSLVLLKTSSYVVSGRDSLGGNTSIPADSISFSSICGVWEVDADSLSLSRSTRSVLQVGFVSQNPPSSICWAACVASIANYRNGGSRTARSVAQGYLGSSYNQGLSTSRIPAVLSANGVSGYSYYGSWPDDTTVNRNIDSGYPLVGIMSVNGNTSSTHAVVVRGCTTLVEVYIMDPEFGFTTAAKMGNSYAYSSGYSGAALRTIGAVRRL